MRHDFVHLHVRSHFSLLNSTIRIEALVTEAHRLGMRAVALTDDGNLFGAIEFYRRALAHGVKPIIGCTLPVDGAPLTLLAENADGYRNLVALSSMLSLDGAISIDALGARAHGLIAFGGSERFRDLFEKDHFFFEVTPEKPDGQKGCPTVATNDVHYLRAEDASVHEALSAIREHRTIGKPRTDRRYMKSADEMRHHFLHDPDALARTVEIAERCSIEFELDKPHLPTFPVADENAHLSELTHARLRELGGGAEYAARLEHELGVIISKGFAGYFLIVADFIAEARRRNFPVGPGRGSAAGSLVAYLLGITEIDPIPHGLIFERFLNPDRAGLPDIDIDLCNRCRDDLIEYVRDRYGRDRVAQIITFGTFGARAALRDIGRIHNATPETDRIARLLDFKMTLTEAREKIPEVARFARDHAPVFNTALSIEGLVRHASRHAAGVVISNVPMTEIVPLYRDADGHVLTQYEMRSVEALGLLKIDILGLKTLTVIADTGAPKPPMPRDDVEVYRLLSRGEGFGIFQLDSSGIRELLTRVKPTTFEDLVAVISLYRPGPMNLAEEFVARKHGRKTIEWLMPELEPILRETYGIILYQEQVMEIAHEIGGYSLAEADELRKAMAKKKMEIMHEHQERFIAGAKARGFAERPAAELFAQMERFAGYGFNKSHAVAYAAIAYETAWLKARYAARFMAATLSHELDNREKMATYLHDARRMKIAVEPPHVNRSDVFFRADERSIQIGLAAIKNVGIAAAEEIVRARGSRDFEDAADFARRVDLRSVSKNAVEALIWVGALDRLGPNRRSIFEALPRLFADAHAGARDRESGQLGFFAESASKIPEMPEARDLASREKELLGIALGELR